MASVSLEQVWKVYPGGHAAVRDLSLEIADGELVVLVGPSGSGKSTVLRVIAGLDPPTAGRVRLGGRDLTDVSPQDRDLAMVFQSYALYPHKTVRDNLTFGLQMRRVDPAVIADRVHAVAAALGIAPLLERRPAQLSGGERQRVALGRAIIREPRGFLLDEPLSNLDPRLRAATRAELALLHRRLDTTMIYVTHDQEEAMTLGSRIAVMRDGALEQVGAPLEVFERPANAFVAQFIGTPAMNLLPETTFGQAPEARRAARRDGSPAVMLGVRPHDLRVVAEREADAIGRVAVCEPLGSTTVLHIQLENLPGALVRVATPADQVLPLDASIGVGVQWDRVHRFDAATGRRVE